MRLSKTKTKHMFQCHLSVWGSLIRRRGLFHVWVWGSFGHENCLHFIVITVLCMFNRLTVTCTRIHACVCTAAYCTFIPNITVGTDAFSNVFKQLPALRFCIYYITGFPGKSFRNWEVESKDYTVKQSFTQSLQAQTHKHSSTCCKCKKQYIQRRCCSFACIKLHWCVREDPNEATGPSVTPPPPVPQLMQAALIRLITKISF